MDAEMVTGVHRNSTRLTKNTTCPPFVTGRTFLAALDGLHATGYVEEVSKGNEGSGKTTRIRATPKLIQKMSVAGFSKPEIADHSTGIRLALGDSNTKTKVQTAFANTHETSRWQTNLNTINSEIGRHVIALDCTQTDFEDLERHRRISAITKGKTHKNPYAYQRLDMDAIRLHRVFNSLDWRDGGRFYGGWWQNVPKTYRKFITIDGKNTCEYDYSSIHPMLLYAKSGQSWPVDEDFYEAPHGAPLREAVKAAFLIMLNVGRKIQARQVPEFDSATAGMTWDQFVSGIVKTHAPIRQYLYTGIGVKLQRMDADIAEAVMLKFAKTRYACLPVHDSFITLASLGDELHENMKGIVMEQLGLEVTVKPQDTHTYSSVDPMVEMDISEQLEPETSEGRRHLAWLLRQDGLNELE
ncbi:MAG: hypothetical protein QNK42_16565 [Pseudodonghicola sp.]|nr:hypothetical protein [Pseudodonghicola sp.]